MRHKGGKRMKKAKLFFGKAAVCLLSAVIVCAVLCVPAAVFAAEETAAPAEAPALGDTALAYVCIISVAVAAMIGVSVVSHVRRVR